MRCPLPAHSFHYVSAALACQYLGRVGELQQCPLLPRHEGWRGTGTGREGAGCLLAGYAETDVAVGSEARAHF